MINQETLSGNWNSIVGAVKQKFGQITGDDLTRVQGNVDQLIGLIQRKTGQTREQVEAFVDSCCSNAGATFQKAQQKGQEMLNQASEFIESGVQEVSERAEKGYECAKETVSKRPLESVAVVAGLGLLAGLAIGLSMASSRR